jgi:hypothetical protein
VAVPAKKATADHVVSGLCVMQVSSVCHRRLRFLGVGPGSR